MDTITVDGIQYQKAASLAREFKYTPDYLGQLCRGRKVDARLVGRTWYVDPESLKQHKAGRYSAARLDTSPANPDPTTATENRRLRVEPQTAKRTMRSIDAHKNFYERLDTRPARYVSDESELLPRVGKPNLDHTLPASLDIAAADAHSVSVTHPKEQPTHFRSGDLPKVVLHGDVSVTEVTAADTREESSSKREKLKNNDISEDEIVNKETSKDTQAPSEESEAGRRTLKVKVTGGGRKAHVATHSSGDHTPTESGRSAQIQTTVPTPERAPLVNSTDAARARAKRQVGEGHELRVSKIASDTPATYGFVRYAPALAALLGFLAGGLLISIDHVLIASAGTYSAGYELNFASAFAPFDP